MATRYGKAFRKKSDRGKHKKGTWIKYKYENDRKVGAVKSKKTRGASNKRSYRRRY